MREWTIITVLKTGGDFRACHAEALRDQCETFAPDARFICLTDDADLLPRDWARPLRHFWPGWWSKMEAYRVAGPSLLMDLDTVILGRLDPLLAEAARHQFTVLRDFNPHQRRLGTGLVAWRESARGFYEEFGAEAAKAIPAYTTPEKWGDQGFVDDYCREWGIEPAFWQDIAPGAVVSWKKQCRDGVPPGARVVCFHGKPRPWDVPDIRG